MTKIIKKNKIGFYIQGFSRPYLPKKNIKNLLLDLERSLSDQQLEFAKERIDYYNKINKKFDVSSFGTTIKTLKKAKSPKAYYFDTYEFARFFDENLPLYYVFGDVIQVPEQPAIVKSRPIAENNKNSVVLNLDKVRHFIWVKNDQPFVEKKNMLIGRGAVFQEHRATFFEKYFHHPLCDLGQVNKIGGKPEAWYKPKISISQHLDYKFILSLEGNDVATNLKWIMSSNSIAVMPKPKYETWFMEGKLIGGTHFIEIKSDYSDVEEQLNFYIAHPEKCLKIVENAHQFCKQFFNKDVEDYCSLKVLERYFIGNS